MGAIETSTTMPTEPVQRLIADEVKLVDRVVKKFGNGYSSSQFLGTTNTESFVKQCLLAHREQVLAWNNWRWHSPVIQQEVLDDTVARDVQVRVQSMWADQSVLVRGLAQKGLIPQPTIHHAFRQRFYAQRGKGEIRLITVAGAAPAFAVPVRFGQSVARAVLSFLKKATYPDMTAEQITSYLKVWDRLFELLGHGWKATDPFSITFSCAPSTFLRLGHMGESQSCMKFGGEQAKGKKYLAAMPGSYVALGYKGEAALREIKNGHGRKGRPCYRAWGATLLKEWAMISNHYISPELTMRPLILETARVAFNIPDPTVVEDKGGELFPKGANQLFYTNGDAKLIFSSRLPIGLLDPMKSTVKMAFENYLNRPVIETSKAPELPGLNSTDWLDVDTVEQCEEAA